MQHTSKLSEVFHVCDEDIASHEHSIRPFVVPYNKFLRFYTKAPQCHESNQDRFQIQLGADQ